MKWLTVRAGELAAISLRKLPICMCEDGFFEEMSGLAMRGIHATHNVTLDSVSLHIEWNISQKPACDNFFYSEICDAH